MTPHVYIATYPHSRRAFQTVLTCLRPLSQLQPGSRHLGDYRRAGSGRLCWGPGAGDGKGAGRALGDLTDSLGWMRGPLGGLLAERPHSLQET